MSRSSRKRYDDRMATAATLPDAPRRILVEETIARIRRDRDVKPLTLCAFLQDHAKLIREIFQCPKS